MVRNKGRHLDLRGNTSFVDRGSLPRKGLEKRLMM